MNRYLLTTCAAAAIFTIGCAANNQVAKNHSHADEAVCEMPEIEGKAAAAPGAPGAPATPAKSYAKFGAEQKMSDDKAITVAQLLAAPDQYEGKYVRVSGVVTSVCPKKGCWMRVAAAGSKPGAENVFIKFPDPPEGMYIPLEAVGHETIIEGKIKNGTLSQAQARHFKQDAGASAEEIEKVVGPQKQVMLAQPAVVIEGVTKTN